MNKLFLPLLLVIFLPVLASRADMVASDAQMAANVPSITLEPIKVSKKFSEFKFQKNPQIPSPPVQKHWVENNNLYTQVASQKDSEEVMVTSDKKYTSSKYAGFLSDVSPDYNINRNFLSLSQVSTPRRKRAMMFVFLMNPNKHPKTLKEQVAERTRIHVMWPGSKKMMVEQKLIEHEYPVDVSIANYKDGYASDEWNVVLPNKKPREVDIALLWSF